MGVSEVLFITEGDMSQRGVASFLCGGGAFDELPVIADNPSCNASASSLLVGNLLVVHGTGNNVVAAGFVRAALPLLDVFLRMLVARSAANDAIAGRKPGRR